MTPVGLGRPTVPHGPIGSGMVMKLMANILSFIQQSAFAEGLTVGSRAGVDPAIVVEAISASYTGSFIFETDGPKILNSSYGPTFTIG